MTNVLRGLWQSFLDLIAHPVVLLLVVWLASCVTLGFAGRIMWELAALGWRVAGKVFGFSAG